MIRKVYCNEAAAILNNLRIKRLEKKNQEFVRLIHIGDASISSTNYDLRFEG